MGGREIWAELRGGQEGGGGEDEEEKKKRRKQGGGGVEKRTGGQQRALSAPLSPLLVPTHTHLQLPTCTGETAQVRREGTLLRGAVHSGTCS